MPPQCSAVFGARSKDCLQIPMTKAPHRPEDGPTSYTSCRAATDRQVPAVRRQLSEFCRRGGIWLFPISTIAEMVSGSLLETFGLDFAMPLSGFPRNPAKQLACKARSKIESESAGLPPKMKAVRQAYTRKSIQNPQQPTFFTEQHQRFFHVDQPSAAFSESASHSKASPIVVLVKVVYASVVVVVQVVASQVITVVWVVGSEHVG